MKKILNEWQGSAKCNYIEMIWRMTLNDGQGGVVRWCEVAKHNIKRRQDDF